MPVIKSTKYQDQIKLAEQLKKINLKESDCCGGCLQEMQCIVENPLCTICCHPFHSNCKGTPDKCVKCHPKLCKYITNNNISNCKLIIKC